MFKSFGNGYFALGLIIGLYAFLPFAYWQSGYLSDRQMSAQHQKHGSLSGHKNNPEKISNTFKPNLAGEFSISDKTDRTDYYEHQDLKAQNSMAESTKAIVYWTKLSMLLAFFGTVFIGWTLYETRRTANITRDIGRKEVSGYCGFTQNNPFCMTDDDNPNLALFFFKFQNSGNSPSVIKFMRTEVYEQGKNCVKVDYESFKGYPISSKDSVPCELKINSLSNASSTAKVVLESEYDDVFGSTFNVKFSAILHRVRNENWGCVPIPGECCFTET